VTLALGVREAAKSQMSWRNTLLLIAISVLLAAAATAAIWIIMHWLAALGTVDPEAVAS
jgi:hypothetical protein